MNHFVWVIDRLKMTSYLSSCMYIQDDCISRIKIWISFVWVSWVFTPNTILWLRLCKFYKTASVSMGSYDSKISRMEHFSCSKTFDKAASEIGPIFGLNRNIFTWIWLKFSKIWDFTISHKNDFNVTICYDVRLIFTGPLIS